MPIALPPVHLAQALPSAPATAGEAGGREVPVGARPNGRATDLAKPVDNPIAAGDKVTLSEVAGTANRTYIPAAPFVEIWKDGRRLAAIDSRGDVSGFDGFAPSSPGGTGLALATQRAALIALATGGEIRVGGTVTDVATLTMNARLREAYGR